MLNLLRLLVVGTLLVLVPYAAADTCNTTVCDSNTECKGFTYQFCFNSTSNTTYNGAMCYASSDCPSYNRANGDLTITLDGASPDIIYNYYSVIKQAVMEAYNNYCNTSDNYKICCPGALSWPNRNSEAYKSAMAGLSEVLIPSSKGSLSPKRTILTIRLAPNQASMLCSALTYTTTTSTTSTTAMTTTGATTTAGATTTGTTTTAATTTTGTTTTAATTTTGTTTTGPTTTTGTTTTGPTTTSGTTTTGPTTTTGTTTTGPTTTTGTTTTGPTTTSGTTTTGPTTTSGTTTTGPTTTSGTTTTGPTTTTGTTTTGPTTTTGTTTTGPTTTSGTTTTGPTTTTGTTTTGPTTTTGTTTTGPTTTTGTTTTGPTTTTGTTTTGATTTTTVATTTSGARRRKRAVDFDTMLAEEERSSDLELLDRQRRSVTIVLPADTVNGIANSVDLKSVIQVALSSQNVTVTVTVATYGTSSSVACNLQSSSILISIVSLLGLLAVSLKHSA